MKAREYAEQYKSNPGTDSLIAIAEAFAVEVKTIGERRHVACDDAVIAILNEQDRKWKAFARLVGVRDDGFEGFIRITMPKIYMAWRG